MFFIVVYFLKTQINYYWVYFIFTSQNPYLSSSFFRLKLRDFKISQFESKWSKIKPPDGSDYTRDEIELRWDLGMALDLKNQLSKKWTAVGSFGSILKLSLEFEIHLSRLLNTKLTNLIHNLCSKMIVTDEFKWRFHGKRRESNPQPPHSCLLAWPLSSLQGLFSLRFISTRLLTASTRKDLRTVIKTADLVTGHIAQSLFISLLLFLNLWPIALEN